MRLGRFRTLAIAAVVALAGASTLIATSTPQTSATASFTFTRQAGINRFDTSSQIATSNFTTAGTVVMASGVNFPDALGGAYLAGALGTAILLLPASGAVPQPILNALSALKTKNISLLGGPSAVGEDVSNQLSNTPSSSSQGGNLVVTRIFGGGRYDTNLATVKAANTAVGSFNNKKTAIVASGANFPDALAAGAVSWAKNFPIIITDPDTLSPQARQALQDLGIQQVIIMGGNAAVSAVVEQQINALGVTTLQRMNGTDRSDTSTKNATYAIANFGFKNTALDVASGDQSFGGADALSAAPAAGKNTTTLVVTNSASDPGADVAFAQTNASTLTSGTAFGGPNPLPDGTLGAIQTAARTVASNQTYSVSPAAAQTKTVSTGSVLTDTSGAINYTASRLGTTSVDVQLFQASVVSVSSSNQVSFTPVGGTSNANPGTVAAKVTTVNGTSTGPTPTSKVISVTPQNGSVTFTVNSTTAESDIPVVFSRADGNDTLELNPQNQPTEGFGIGGTAIWLPPQGNAGNIAQGSVTAIDSASPPTYLVLSAAFPGTDEARTYNIKGGDTFQLFQPPSAAFAGGTCTSTTAADFFSKLSLGDGLQGTYSTTGGSSILCLNEIAPAAPPSLAISAPASNPSGGAVLTIGDAATASVASYNVYRFAKAASACPTVPVTPAGASLASLGFSKVGNQADADPGVGSGTAATFNDTGLSASTTYCYAVTSVDQSGEESRFPANADGAVFGPAAGYTTSAAAAATAPASVSTAQAITSGHTTPGTGDQLVVNFDQPVAVASTFSMVLRDQAGVPNTMEINQTNATTALSNGGTTVTYTLTSNPSSSPAALALSKVEIFSQTGVSSATGQWNLAKSGAIKGGGSTLATVFSRMFFGTNADIATAAPIITVATVTATGSAAANTVQATGCGAGQKLLVYNAVTGALLNAGGTTCAGGTTTVNPSPALTSGETLIATVLPSTNAQEGVGAWSAMALTATGNSAATPANTITVNFSQPVTCTVSGTSAGQYVFTPAGGGAPVTATANTCPGAAGGTSVTLTFAALPANNTGVLTYTPGAVAADRLTGGTGSFAVGVAVPNQNLSAPIGT